VQLTFFPPDVNVSYTTTNGCFTHSYRRQETKE